MLLCHLIISICEVADPPYISPTIELLLRQRNKLRPAGKVEQADHLAVHINRLIARRRSKLLSEANNHDTKQLWELLKKTDNWGGKSKPAIDLDHDIINDYFAAVATYADYCRADVMRACVKSSPCQNNQNNKNSSSCTYSRNVIETLLARVGKTSSGNDDIPYWMFRDCASAIAGVVAKIVNFTLTTGVAPAAWQIAVITPVPKHSPITGPNDLRPISVTPILSLIVKRLVVKDHIMPFLPCEQIFDQYGFKRTGSTTAALIDVTHTVMTMLETGSYVQCLLIDFSKAFDSVDHLKLVNKLKQYGLSHSIITWIVSFLTDRLQYTFEVTYRGSNLLNAPLFKVLASALIFSIIMILNLKTRAAMNHMAKYADAATLLVPKLTSLSIEEEFRCVQKWACDNKLSVNLSKTKEIVFYRLNPRSIIVPSPLPNIDRVTIIKLLGVYISHDLATNAQTEYVLKICNQSLYLLNQLKKQSLPRHQLQQVFESIVLSRITYAVAAW